MTVSYSFLCQYLLSISWQGMKAWWKWHPHDLNLSCCPWDHGKCNTDDLRDWSWSWKASTRYGQVSWWIALESRMRKDFGLCYVAKRSINSDFKIWRSSAIILKGKQLVSSFVVNHQWPMCRIPVFVFHRWRHGLQGTYNAAKMSSVEFSFGLIWRTSPWDRWMIWWFDRKLARSKEPETWSKVCCKIISCCRAWSWRIGSYVSFDLLCLHSQKQGTKKACWQWKDGFFMTFDDELHFQKMDSNSSQGELWEVFWNGGWPKRARHR